MRIELDRMAEILDCVRILAELGVDDAARVVSGRVGGIALNDVGEGRDIAGVGGLSPRFRVDLRHVGVKSAERLAACRKHQRDRRRPGPRPNAFRGQLSHPPLNRRPKAAGR